MPRRSRLVRYYLVSVLVAIALFTVLYDTGMTVYENDPRTLLESLEVVLQTLTTTGFGQDSGWESTEMTTLVIVMEASSILLISAAFPVVILPLIEDALSTTPPTSREDLSDHVVVCAHSVRTDSLIDELEARKVPYVIVEPDREQATDLYEEGREVVHGDPEAVDVLEGVRVGEARAVVSDADDDVDLSIIMSAKEAAPDVPVYSIAESADLVDYHEHAGADRVFSPRGLLGNGLANKVRNTVKTDLDGAAEVGDHLEIGELPIEAGSELTGRRLGECDIQDRTGAKIIGAWSRGEFRIPPFPDLRLDETTVLLVVGSRPALRGLEQLTLSESRRYGRGQVLVVGFGVVGSIIGDALAKDDINRTVVDVDDKPGVDVVGDATDEQTLRKAGIDDARTVVLALDDDTTTLLVAFVVREIAPDVEIVARADDTENVNKIYRAGADYVLALATVTGRLLASAILQEDREIAFDEQIRLVRLEPGSLAGQTLEEAQVRERTRCTVVALEHRDGRVSTDLGGWTRIKPTDHLVVAGVDRHIEQLRDLL